MILYEKAVNGGMIYIDGFSAFYFSILLNQLECLHLILGLHLDDVYTFG